MYKPSRLALQDENVLHLSFGVHSNYTFSVSFFGCKKSPLNVSLALMYIFIHVFCNSVPWSTPEGKELFLIVN